MIKLYNRNGNLTTYKSAFFIIYLYKYIIPFSLCQIKLVRGLLVLCNAGLMSDAKILLRSLFEVAYYCEYILIDPKDIKAAENIMALAAFEEKNTEESPGRPGRERTV